MSDIWRDDRLGRKADAEFLRNYLLQRNKLAIEKSDSKGTSINLNAPWGAGKSFFLRCFEKQLKMDGFKVAFVDAWKDDHAEDPMFAVMSAIVRALDEEENSERVRKLANTLGKISGRLVLGAAKRAAEYIVSAEDVAGIADDLMKVGVGTAEELLSEYGSKALARFDAGQKAIAEFRKLLEDRVQGEAPLFVLVDELDRCRPTYAISLLERVKHLFDVRNVIFVFGTNGEQLCHTIRTVYGAGFAAEMYLKRFFDRTYEFDNPTIYEYVRQHWENLLLHERKYVESYGVDYVEFVSIFSTKKGLSLRDIQQCLELFWSVCGSFSSELPIPILYVYPVIVAYQQGQDEVFRIACGEQHWNGNRNSSVVRFFDDTDFYEGNMARTRPILNVLASNSLFTVINEFMRFLVNGIRTSPDNASSAARYVEEFRVGEWTARQSDFQSGRAAVSVLAVLGSVIRRAGRMLTVSSGVV